MATCGPSRASILTSRHPSTTRVFDTYSCERFPFELVVACVQRGLPTLCLPRASSPDWRNSSGNFTTIPEYFKNRGYMTADIEAVKKVLRGGHR